MPSNHLIFCRQEKRMTEDETVGWHHRFHGHEFEQDLGVGDIQGSLVCCSPWGRKESDTTEQLNWTDNMEAYLLTFPSCAQFSQPKMSSWPRLSPSDILISWIWNWYWKDTSQCLQVALELKNVNPFVFHVHEKNQKKLNWSKWKEERCNGVGKGPIQRSIFPAWVLSQGGDMGYTLKSKHPFIYDTV